VGVGTTTVVMTKRTDGSEAERILDQLESVTGLHGKRVGGTRRYDLDESKDLIIAMASIKGQLDEISASWPAHIGIDIE
jgi:hypothetical protein